MSESESRVTASNDNLAPKNVPAKGGNNKLEAKTHWAGKGGV